MLVLENGRSVLDVHHHDVDAGMLHARDALAQDVRRRKRIDIAQYVVGADLPDDEIGMRGDDVGFDALRGRRRGLAADAAVEHLDPHAGKAQRQHLRQAARIGLVRARGAGAVGRRRAEGDNGQRTAARQRPGDMRQAQSDGGDILAEGTLIHGGSRAMAGRRDEQKGQGNDEHQHNRDERMLPTQQRRARRPGFQATERHDRWRRPSARRGIGRFPRPAQLAGRSAHRPDRNGRYRSNIS